jgi:hypothetical protein
MELTGKVVSNKSPSAAKDKKGALPDKHTVGQGSHIKEGSPKGGQPNRVEARRVEARGFPGKKGAKDKKGKPKKGVNPFASKAKGAGSRRVRMSAAHNSTPFKKTGSISKGPAKTVTKVPQNRPGSNLGSGGQKGVR